jgi:hypothetical protein
MHLEQIKLFARAGNWPVHNYGKTHFSLTTAMIQELRGLSYLDQWRTSLAKGWYHLLMEDQSILVFNETDTSASFSFLQCPLEIPSLREFLSDRSLDYTSRNRDAYADDYQLVIDTADLRKHVTPVRFDYDEKGYRCGVHPVSHIHIGLDNDIRLGYSKKMSAISFCLFIMRQFYPESWARILDRPELKRLKKSVRDYCSTLPHDYWKVHDSIELHFS